MAKYLDIDGLQHNINKTKEYVQGCVENKVGRNYAKGTGNGLKFDQDELGSSTNADANSGNCFIYPISGLKQGDVVTVSFDWYYKDVDGIDHAFNQYGEDTGDTSRNTNFQISLGEAYNCGSGWFVGKTNYQQYKISDTECKGHCVKTVTIGAGNVDTISYPYIQNQWVGVAGGNHYLEISNFMITKGDKESQWNPAPEDTQGFVFTIDYPAATSPRKKIMPGLYNKLGAAAQSSIICGFRQLASTNKTNPEYIFEWTSGANGTTLSMPSGVKWLNNETPVFEANKKYQVSIVNNLAIAAAF